jgi:hypothetical protein
MLVGWRMIEDMETMSGLPDGSLNIDVLAGTASHSSASLPPLHIVGELHAWLKSRLEKAGVPIQQLIVADVVAAICTDRIATDRKHIVSFDFVCTCTIRTVERTYEGHLVEKHQYHGRLNPGGA